MGSSSVGDLKLFERVPVGLGVAYQEHSRDGLNLEEYSIEFHHGTYSYQVEGVDRHVQSDAVRLVYTYLWRIEGGLFSGIGTGGRFDSIRIIDKDPVWVPPETYRYHPFTFHVILAGKVGYDCGLGFYVEGAVMLGLGTYGFITGAELAMGFRF